VTTVVRELRQSVRSLGASPGFAVVVVVTLAVAIGINTTIFTIVNAVLLRPLPFAEPARLVTLWENNRAEGQERVDVSGLTFLDWRVRAKSFAALGAWRYRGFTMTEGLEAERVTSVEITPDGLDALGVPASLGRLFDEASGQPGGERQVLLSAGAWARRFGSDPLVVGRSLRLDDQTFVVAGVMPAGFQFPPADPSVEMWSPLVLAPGALPSRPHRMYQAIGRLRPGVSIGQAQADMDAVADGIAREHPDSNAGWSVTLIPAHEQVVGNIGTTLWVLFGAVVLVLLIACANVASLLVARSTRTSKDFAVRAAFGASAFALARRSLLESALLALAGGSAGIALAWWAMGALRRIVPASVPRADQIGVDWVVLAFAATVTGVAGLAFGLVPAWRAMRPSVLAVLQEGGRGAVGSRRSRRAANALVAIEVALALVLLVAAGLLAQSFARLVSVDPGFRTSGVTAVHVALPAARYGPSASKREFFDRLVGQLAATPGVQSAGAVSVLPMSPLGQDFDLSFTIDGLETTSPSERPRANYRGVIAGYFETMGIALREGRLFDGFDGRENGPRVAIVNETAVRRYFQNGSAINRAVKIPMAGDLKIVGVVADVKHYGLDAAPDVEVFVPYAQLALSEMQVVVRPGPGGGSVAPTVRAAIAAIDPAVPMGKVSQIEDLMANAVAQPRFNTALLIGLALCAALLAAIGVYGVVTHAVSRRTAEIGLRMALGADAAVTFRHVVMGAVRVVAVGVAIGLAGAALLGPSLRSLLFGVAPLDPLTYVVAGGALLCVGGLAASVPARRAARIDPVEALRQE
jgi:putative ABC transport system permease protein